MKIKLIGTRVRDRGLPELPTGTVIAPINDDEATVHYDDPEYGDDLVRHEQLEAVI